MEELSLNILDVAMNSVAAGAENIDISVIVSGGILTLTIADDGKGMSEEFVKNVTNPFTTTRKTRKVGLGLPFLKLAAEQAGGELSIFSSTGQNHGTIVRATFDTNNIDCLPLGDIAFTVSTLIQGSPDRDFTFLYRTEAGEKRLSTKEMRGVLVDVPLNEPSVLNWVRELINEPFADEG